MTYLDGKNNSTVTSEPVADEFCQCSCKMYQLREGEQYGAVCTCSNTSTCPSFECKPKWNEEFENEYHEDEYSEGEAFDRMKRLSGKDPARKKLSTAEIILMRDLSTRSVLGNIHLPEGSQEEVRCLCECALSKKLDRVACDCLGEENNVCDSLWFCDFTERLQSPTGIEPIVKHVVCAFVQSVNQ